jgi:methylglutaconyl-CoA hydratase
MSETEGPLVVVEERKQVVTLTINRPAQRNAMSRGVLDALLAAIDNVAVRRDVRAVIFTGAGDKAFCAGADLKERAGMSPEETRAFLRRIRRVMDHTERLPMPTLAALDGVAFGGGCELALACDLRVMGEGAQLGLTECALGIIPGAGGTQRLPRLVGPSVAKELIFTARRLSAAEALAVGLVNHATPAGGALAKAREIAEEIKRCAPLAVEAAKAAIDGGIGAGISEGTLLEARAYEVTLFTEDRLEALAAFREKRAPVFHGR